MFSAKSYPKRLIFTKVNKKSCKAVHTLTLLNALNYTAAAASLLKSHNKENVCLTFEIRMNSLYLDR